MIRRHKDKQGKPYYTEKESIDADIALLEKAYSLINETLYSIAEFRQFRAITYISHHNKELRELNNAEFDWMKTLLETRQKIHAFSRMYEDLSTGAGVNASLETYKEERGFLEKTYGMDNLIHELLAEGKKRAKEQSE